MIDDDDYYPPPELELEDSEIPEYWPHLRENRAERYHKARRLLKERAEREAQLRQTFIEIIELPEI